jgi:predicted N-formylglutamate amidohydrolase
MPGCRAKAGSRLALAAAAQYESAVMTPFDTPRIEQRPIEIANPEGGAPVLLLCDHASNVVPEAVGGGTLGLPPAEMARHIAYDIGARAVTLALAGLLDAPALLSRFSRLVIDPNRSEDDPTLVMRLYDGTLVPGNRHITPEETQRRIETYHRPYHEAVTRQIDLMIAQGRTPALIAIHSYTPQLKGRPLRPWHVGILWHHDGRLAVPLMQRLRAEAGLCVGDNQPYTGQLEGDSMSRHGTGRGLAHVLIELRHDLIATEADQRLWAERLAPILQDVVAQSRAEGERDG